MGSVVQLKNKINNSYFQLKNSVEDRLMLVEEKIKSKLEIRPVKWIDEVFDLVLTEKPKVWEEKGENSSKPSRGRKTRKDKLETH